MSKILKYVIGFIVFTIILGLAIYSSATSPINRYGDTSEDPGIIIVIIITGLISVGAYLIAKKLTQKGYSRLKVRFTFSIFIALGTGIAFNIKWILSGESISFNYTLLIMVIIGAVVFMRSYGDKLIGIRDLLDFDREEKKKIDSKKFLKDSLLVLFIMLIPLVSILVVVIIIYLLK